MALPKSTIVMAVLTCVPFGIAVRDHFSEKEGRGYDSGDEDDDFDEADIDLESLERESKAARDEYEAERRREQERVAERKAGLADLANLLFGNEPASLGRPFGAIKLGMTDAELDKQEDTVVVVRAFADPYDIGVTFHADSGVLDGITLESNGSTESGEQLCEVLGETLDTRWPEHARVRGTTVWVGKGQRVELSGSYDCKVEIHQAVAPAAWIAKSGSVVPVAMIGKPHAELVKSLSPQRVDLSDAEYSISWKGPGLGAGTGATALDAFIRNGKVVAITAAVNIDDTTFAALERQLEAAFGPAKERDGEPVWGSKVPVTITVAGDYDGPATHVVTVGTIPSEE
ncbi:MAG TPA: hypothetical protein VM513_02600 [Kofleriaceae bacterium]|jgi:hypothetical protein|nr:hypothetical protein [Kofleriaceae bacterium]